LANGSLVLLLVSLYLVSRVLTKMNTCEIIGLNARYNISIKSTLPVMV
jgi:hypothetical protein